MRLLATAAAWLVEPAEEERHAGPLVEAQPAARRRRAALWPIAAPDAEPIALARIREDDAPRSAQRGLVAATPGRIAVLGVPSAVPAVAAAIALGCRAGARAPAALVLLWRAAGAPDRLPGRGGGPVMPGAGALAARLCRRDLPVTARGRLVWLRLSPGDDALPTLRRAEAAIGELPSVLAVVRPRDAAVDEALAERDRLILATDEASPLASVAAEDVAALGVPSHTCRLIPPGAGRFLALAGLRSPRLEAVPPPHAGHLHLVGASR